MIILMPWKPQPHADIGSYVRASFKERSWIAFVSTNSLSKDANRMQTYGYYIIGITPSWIGSFKSGQEAMQECDTVLVSTNHFRVIADKLAVMV